MNYFGISEYYRPIPEIDHWLRRRLRMYYFKQWRWAKTKVRELRKLGTSLHAIIPVAISRKGPWRLSRTLATQTGKTNDWLKDIKGFCLSKSCGFTFTTRLRSCHLCEPPGADPHTG